MTAEFNRSIEVVYRAAMQDALQQAAAELRAQAEACDYWTLARAFGHAAERLVATSDSYATDDDTLIRAERFLTEYAAAHDGYAE